jgi:hypothetical protein
MGPGASVELNCSVAKQTFRSAASQSSRNLPEWLAGVGQLIDVGRFGDARQKLEVGGGDSPELVELMRLKLSVAEHQLEPSSALSSVIAFLRKDPGNPVALELYQELSMLQYQAGQSCPSHSHPPPPRR